MGLSFRGESIFSVGLCVFRRSGVLGTGMRDHNVGERAMLCVGVLHGRNFLIVGLCVYSGLGIWTWHGVGSSMCATLTPVSWVVVARQQWNPLRGLRSAWGMTQHVTGILGLFNVALNHARCDVGGRGQANGDCVPL